MLWNISRPGSTIVDNEDGEWIATFKDAATAESVIALHNHLPQLNLTTANDAGSNEATQSVTHIHSNWSSSARW